MTNNNLHHSTPTNPTNHSNYNHSFHSIFMDDCTLSSDAYVDDSDQDTSTIVSAFLQQQRSDEFSLSS